MLCTWKQFLCIISMPIFIMKNSKYFKLIFPLFISSLFCCHNKRTNERVRKMKLTNIAYALCFMLIKWALGIWHARTSAIWAGCEQHSIHFGVDEHQLECAICKGQNANILKRKIPFKRRYSHTRTHIISQLPQAVRWIRSN